MSGRFMGEDRQPSASWLRRPSPAPEAAARVFCCPHAGGSASAYRWLGTALAPLAEVLTVQYPGRQDRIREPDVEDLTEVADAVVAEAQTWCDRPVAVFGHSMGALVAHEVTLRLERAGAHVMALIVSGRSPDPAPVPSSTAADEEIVRHLVQLAPANAAVLADPELRALVLPAIRSDYGAVARYRPPARPQVRCRVLGLVGGSDPGVAPLRMEGWRRYAPSGFELRVLPGGHFYLDEQRAEVAVVLRSYLRALLEGASTCSRMGGAAPSQAG